MYSRLHNKRNVSSQGLNQAGPLSPGSWMQDPGSWILDPGSRIQDPGSWILDPGSWIQDPGLLSTWYIHDYCITIPR